MQRRTNTSIYNKKTDWKSFTDYLDTRLNFKIPLKTRIGIENDVRYLTKEMQTAITQSTSAHQYKKVAKTIQYQSGNWS